MVASQIEYIVPSDIKGNSIDLFHGSVRIRNKALSENKGKYSEYQESLSATGGEAVGEAYFVSETLKPEGMGTDILTFTHDDPQNEALLRNKNLKSAFYDYEESKDIEVSLTPTTTPTPWNNKLYGYSDVSTEENSVKFDDYREYAKSMFRFGLSFEKTQQEFMNSLMFNGYTSQKSLVNDITLFIDSHQGTILDPVPTDWANGDTKLGYIGKKMVSNQRYLQHGPVFEPITKGLTPEAYAEKERGIRKKGNTGVDFSRDEVYTDVTQDEGNFVQKIENGENTEDSSTDTVKAIREHNLDGNRLFKPSKKYISFVGDEEFGAKRVEPNPVQNDVTSQKNRTVKNPEEFNINNGGIVQSLIPGETAYGSIGYQEYNEGDTPGGSNNRTFNEKDNYDERIISSVIDNGSNSKSLLDKTRRLFNGHKIDTLIGRFHTSVADNPDSGKLQETQTAVTRHGLSHGRNLLKKNGARDTNNGYDNPYCRVWTFHHQYSKMSDLIRPFGGEKIEELQANYPGRPILGFTKDAGTKNWSEKTVLNRNGLVNIAPMKGPDGSQTVNIKQCMFSLENLAWKDMPPREQVFPESERGPLGGRIMWFPPYDIQITETSNPEWNKNTFIGRGESVYTYANTERTGTLSFTIVADHPSVIDYWIKNHNGGDGFHNKTEAEQDLLRFFAGCENLDMLEMSKQILNETDEKVNEETKPKEASVEPEFTPSKGFNGENGFAFYIYFPNNLSGKDYITTPNLVTDYLLLGKHKSENVETGYTVNGVKWEVYDRNIEKTVRATDAAAANPWGYETGKDADNPGTSMNLGITESDDGQAFQHRIEDSINNNKSQPKGTDPKKSKFIWGYGRDNDTASQRLSAGDKSGNPRPMQYIDYDDFGLNATRKSFDDPKINCSFIDAYLAIQLKNDTNAMPRAKLLERIRSANTLRSVDDTAVLVSNMRSKLFDLQGLNTPDSLITNSKNVKRHIYYSVKGGASDHGDSNLNSGLAANRREFIIAWLKENGGKDWEYQEDTTDIKVITETDSKSTSSDKAKEGRRARVIIWWEDEKITPVVEKKVEEIKPASKVANDMFTIVTYSGGNDYSRYGTEYQFFKEIQRTDNILYRNIVDKVKYFDPAFHAITPEGFNGRLAFLHQCTRMGPTVESTSLRQNRTGYAGNLAFGRAPVCVLRLGDFYNTRIVINSMNINFDTNQWDLNPEGIGVQPMLAKVNLSFTFQGGSSLGGPVTRLQNAISFNFYANQEVYDDRADVMVYDENGVPTTASTIWDPWDERDRGQKSVGERMIGVDENGNAIYGAGTGVAKYRSNGYSGGTVSNPRQEYVMKKIVEEIQNNCSSVSFRDLEDEWKDPSGRTYSYVTIINICDAFYEKTKENLIVHLYNCHNSSIKDWVKRTINAYYVTVLNAIDIIGRPFKLYLMSDFISEDEDIKTVDYVAERYRSNSGAEKKNFFNGIMDDECASFISDKIGPNKEIDIPQIYASIIYQFLYTNVPASYAEGLEKMNSIGYTISGVLLSLTPNTPLAKYNDKKANEILKKQDIFDKPNWKLRLGDFLITQP